MLGPQLSETLPINNAMDIVSARRTARSLCQQLGFSNADQTRLATAVSELTRNVIQYAGHGECLIEDCSDELSRRIRVCVRDWGPGIADVEQALQDGFSTSGGLGAGLPGTRRLVDEFTILSDHQGTRVTIVLTRPYRMR